MDKPKRKKAADVDADVGDHTDLANPSHSVLSNDLLPDMKMMSRNAGEAKHGYLSCQAAAIAVLESAPAPQWEARFVSEHVVEIQLEAGLLVTSPLQFIEYVYMIKESEIMVSDDWKVRNTDLVGPGELVEDLMSAYRAGSMDWWDVLDALAKEADNQLDVYCHASIWLHTAYLDAKRRAPIKEADRRGCAEASKRRGMELDRGTERPDLRETERQEWS